MNFQQTVLGCALLFAAAAGTVMGQAATPQAPGATRNGAGPTRANGATPTAPGLNGAAPGSSPAGGGAGTGPGRPAQTKQAPAAAANSKVEVIGRPAENRTGSADRPLLPIAAPGNALGVRSGTQISVRVKQSVDSGHAHNGDMLEGTLAKPVAGLPAGTPVRLTVVAVSPAGQLSSFGELSLQIVSIADRRLLSDTVTAQGREGAKELPDAAPARGTEAVFSPEVPVCFPAA